MKNGQKTLCLLYPTGIVGTMELFKEIGMIPRTAAQNGFDCTIACYADASVPPVWEGVKIKVFRRRCGLPLARALTRHFGMILWTLVNASYFDYAVVIHSSRASLMLARIYRFRNRAGKLYFKSDLSTAFLDSICSSPKSLSVFERLVETSNITGVETSRMVDAAKALFLGRPEISGKILLIPNGFEPFGRAAYLADRRYKERSILYVGHVGTEAKNSDLLLSAFERIADTGWKLILVGPIAENFKKKLDDMILRRPGLIVAAGPVLDRETLYSFYRSASIFCLTSRWESFCYALLEAAYFDDYLVSTDVGVVRDIIENGAPGEICEATPESVASALKNAINKIESGDVQINNAEIRKKYAWAAVFGSIIEYSAEVTTVFSSARNNA